MLGLPLGVQLRTLVSLSVVNILISLANLYGLTTIQELLA